MSEAELQRHQIAEPLPEKNTFIDYPPAPMASPATPTSTAPAATFFKRFQLANAASTAPNPILLGSNRDNAHGGACASSSMRTVDKVNCSQEVDDIVSTPASCHHCGNLFMPDASFCRKCGKPRYGHADAEPVLDSSRSIDCLPDSPECEEAAEKVAGLPSIGSTEHELGTCSPCAWYWKPGGCKNGSACSHCHLCLAGTRKAMKKAKVMKLRAQDTPGQEKKAPAYVTSGSESPWPPAVASSGSALPSLSETIALFDAMEKDESMNIAPVKVQVKNTFIQIDADSSHADPPFNSAPGDFFRRCFQTRQAQEAGKPSRISPPVQETGHPSPIAPPMPALSPDPAQCPAQSSLHSIQVSSDETAQRIDTTVLQTFPANAHTGAEEGMTGIQAHALGRCTPCAYYWYKKDGCRLEAECKFCHLCQKGEIKKRKKHRIHHLKAVGAFIPGYSQIQRELWC